MTIDETQKPSTIYENITTAKQLENLFIVINDTTKIITSKVILFVGFDMLFSTFFWEVNSVKCAMCVYIVFYGFYIATQYLALHCYTILFIP